MKKHEKQEAPERTIVLLAEEKPEWISKYKAAFKNSEYELRLFTTGEAAWQAIQKLGEERDEAIIIAPMHMEDRGGVNIARSMREARIIMPIMLTCNLEARGDSTTIITNGGTMAAPKTADPEELKKLIEKTTELFGKQTGKRERRQERLALAEEIRKNPPPKPEKQHRFAKRREKSTGHER